MDQSIRYLQARVFEEVEGRREAMIGWFQACEWAKVWEKAGVMVQMKPVVL